MDTQSPVRFGIAGVGRIAGAHLLAIDALSPQEAVLSAVATRKSQLPFELPEGGRVHARYGDLLEDPSVDAVIICYPNAMHYDAVLSAIEAGKHVLVEKPIGMNAAEVSEMVEAAERRGVQLMSAQSRRFSDAIEAVRDAIPEIGPIIRIVINFLVRFDGPPTGWWNDPESAGDLIVHLQGSHSVDTIVWLLEAEPNYVAARTANVNKQFTGSDEADILLGFEGGVSAAVHLSLNTSPFLHELVVVGTEGSMTMLEEPTGVPFGFKYRLSVNGQARIDGAQDPSLYTKQLAEFVAALKEERPPRASGRDVLRTTRVLDSILSAARAQN